MAYGLRFLSFVGSLGHFSGGGGRFANWADGWVRNWNMRVTFPVGATESEWNGTTTAKKNKENSFISHYIRIIRKIWILILLRRGPKKAIEEKRERFHSYSYSGRLLPLSWSYVLYFIVLKLKYHVIIIGPHRFSFFCRASLSSTI